MLHQLEQPVPLGPRLKVHPHQNHSVRMDVIQLEVLKSLTAWQILWSTSRRLGLKRCLALFVYLKQPYYATRVNAAGIENRVHELNKKSLSEETSKAGFWEEFDSLQKNRKPNNWFDRHEGHET